MTGERDDRGSSTRGDTATASAPRYLDFGEFRIDLVRRRLTRAGERLAIQRKPLDVLIHLAQRPGEVVTRSGLLDAHWRGQVHDEALTRCIGIVRRTLDDTRDPPRFVETVWGQGYRFIAPVTALADGEDATSVTGNAFEAGRHDGGVETADARTSSTTSSRPRFAILFFAALVVLAATALAWKRYTSVDAPVERRIAVLPMTWSSPEDEWLARALTDRLAETISRIEGVAVVARSAGESGSPGASDPVALGRMLEVESVLTSRLTRIDEGIGLSARLIGTRGGDVDWSFSLPAASADADPAVIEQLVGAVARQLWADLAVPKPATKVGPQAYRAYLRARYYWNQRTETGLRAAIDAYGEALEREPEFAEAHVGLAESWLLLPLYGAVAPTEAIPRARAAAERALELDPRQARALAVLGAIAMQFDWDWPAAEAMLRQALTLQPNDATTEQWLGELYCYQRRFEACRQHLRIALGLEPLSPVLRMLTASPDLFSGNFEGAVTAYRAALEDVPGFPIALYALGMSHAGLAEWDAAVASYRAAEPGLGFAFTGGPLVYALARNGQPEQAAEMLELLTALAEQRYVPPSKLAIAWLGMGERTRALEWLGRAVEAHDDRLVYLAVDPHFAGLHDDPSFRRILDEVGLATALERH